MLLISLDLVRHPARPGHRADHREDGWRTDRAPLPGFGVLELDGFKSRLAIHLANLRAVTNLDLRALLHPSREIGRHTLAEIVAPDDEDHLGRGLREKHGCLSRRIPSASNDHCLAAATTRLHRGRCIIDADALEALTTLRVQAAIFRARGDDDGLRVDDGAAIFRFQRKAVIARSK